MKQGHCCDPSAGLTRISIELSGKFEHGFLGSDVDPQSVTLRSSPGPSGLGTVLPPPPLTKAKLSRVIGDTVGADTPPVHVDSWIFTRVCIDSVCRHSGPLTLRTAG